MKRVVNILIGLTFLILMTGCKKEQPKPPEVVRPVKYMEVPDKKSTILRSFPGIILPNQNSIVSFEVPGKINDITVLKGDRVLKGQLLASLDPSKYQDEVDLTSAKYREALAQFKRGEALIKNAYISRSDYDKLKSNMEIAKAKLSTAQTNLDYTKAYAPFNGVIAQRFVEKFEQVKAKEPVLDVHDISNVDIEIDVPENIVIHFKAMEKQQEEMPTEKDTPRAYFEAIPDASYPLTFKEFTAEADPNTQTYAIRFTIKQPEDVVILPGMSVTVKAWIPDISGSPDDFNLIPASAVFADQNSQSAVWVIDPSSMQVHKRNVEVSKLTGEKVRVLSGLQPGDKIVTAGAQFLREGQKVSYYHLPGEKKTNTSDSDTKNATKGDAK